MDDPDKKTTYAAEDMVLAWLDAAPSPSGEVQVTLERDGHRQTVTYVPETEPRFSSPAEVRSFVATVMTRLQQQARVHGSPYRGRERRPVQVMSHRGWTKATYRDDVIHLPERERGGAWALRGMVVLHELAHHLNTGDGAIIDHHGRGFRQTFVQLLEDLGWVQIAAMLRDAFASVGTGRGPSGEDGMLSRVGKLLRHAEGASTEAERDAFLSKAQQLATTHSIELAVARAATDQKDESPTFEVLRLGHRGQQSNVRYIELMLAISRANDVRCTIRTDNTGVTLFGYPADLAVCTTLYASLVVQMVSDADAYIRSGAHRPVHGRTARVAFYQGWTARIGQRLREAQRAAEVDAGAWVEAVDEATGRVEGTRLPALVAKEVEVADYFQHMLRQRGVTSTWRGSSRVVDPRSTRRGRAAADRARLGREKALPGR